VTLVRDGNLTQAIRDAARGGVDVILDPLGTSLLDVDLLSQLIAGNVAIAGFSMSRLSMTAPATVAAALGSGLRLLADGKADLTVTTISSLDQVPAIHQLLAEGRGTGKYVATLKVPD